CISKTRPRYELYDNWIATAIRTQRATNYNNEKAVNMYVFGKVENPRRAAYIIFDGISIDPNSLEKYCETFSRETLTEMTCPVTFESFLKRVRKATSGLSDYVVRSGF